MRETQQACGSHRNDFVGQRIMLDVLGQMSGQPDHWALVAVVQRRTGVDYVTLGNAIKAMVARGWMESASTFRRQRVRLTEKGRAMLNLPGSDRRLHRVEYWRQGRTRRRLATRHM